MTLLEKERVLRRVDKFTGCLLGVAVGDALGAPLEFLSRKQILELTAGQPIREMCSGGWLEVNPGEYTDDTQMTLCIARSLVEKRRFDPVDISARFVDWMQTGPKDIGGTTIKALKYLEKNPGDWLEAGQLTAAIGVKAAGNGSLMRCAPVALFFAGNKKKIITASEDSSQITHGSEEARACCVGQNLAIDFLLTNSRDGLLDYLLTEIRNETVLSILRSLPAKDIDQLKPTGYCVDSFECALWCLLNASTFEEAVVLAVNLGGDADTIGAITGALAGANWGVESIPGRWMSILQGKEELFNLAQGICSLNSN